MNLHNNLIEIKYKKLNQFFKKIEKINYAHIKGEALSIQAYKHEGARVLSDIDILINVKDLSKIEKVLIEEGFHKTNKNRKQEIMVMSTSHQIVPWVKDIRPWGKIYIDINFDIFWGEYQKNRIDMEEFLSDVVELKIHNCNIKTLQLYKAIIHTILHAYKDLNSIFLLVTRKTIKIDLFKDIYFLIKNNINFIDWNEFYSISLKYEIIDYVYYLLFFTNQLFKDNSLEKYINIFKTNDGVKLLNCYGLCDAERKEWKYDFFTRIKSENVYNLIKNDLVNDDIEKIKYNCENFGVKWKDTI